MSTRDSPASRRAIASWRWWCVSFGLRPITTPLALARSQITPAKSTSMVLCKILDFCTEPINARYAGLACLFANALSLPSLTQFTSKPPVTAREQDVGADREPEGAIADNRYLDEHANDRKHHQYEREHKPKVHYTYLIALRRNAKNRAVVRGVSASRGP
jgi:hypothetical protein